MIEAHKEAMTKGLAAKAKRGDNPAIEADLQDFCFDWSTRFVEKMKYPTKGSPPNAEEQFVVDLFYCLLENNTLPLFLAREVTLDDPADMAGAAGDRAFTAVAETPPSGRPTKYCKTKISRRRLR